MASLGPFGIDPSSIQLSGVHPDFMINLRERMLESRHFKDFSVEIRTSGGCYEV